jgi:hypothetical protein
LILVLGFLIFLYETANVIRIIRNNQGANELFDSCYFMRQLCDIANGDGINTKVFRHLSSCSEGLALVYAALQTFVLDMFVNLGFVATNAVLRGPIASILTFRTRMSFISSVLSVSFNALNSAVFFFLFHRFGKNVKNFGDAQWSLTIFVLVSLEVLSATGSLTVAFYALNENPNFAGSIFPCLKLIGFIATSLSLINHTRGGARQVSRTGLLHFGWDKTILHVAE